MVQLVSILMSRLEMLSRNLVIRNFDVLVCTVGSAGPSVSCLGV